MLSTQRVIAATCFLSTVCFLSQITHAADEATKLHSILKSDASIREKGVACKRLAVIGRKESIPILAELLSHDQLSHSARFALEAMPNAAVDRVFRESLKTLKRTQLVGVINSIGLRKDTEADSRLIELLDSSDSQVEAAASAALAQIANEQSVVAILQRLKSKADTAIADACLTCAERLMASNQSDRAIEVYDVLRQSDAPKHIRVAATYSAIRARGSSGLSLLREQLQGDDDELFAIALQAARDLPNDDVSAALTAEIDQQAADRKALLITALGDLRANAALPKLRDSVKADSPAVRIAAIRGLRQIGTSEDVELLLAVATSDDEATAEAARKTLKDLSGATIDEAIAEELAEKDSKRYDLLIELAGSRRIASTVPMLFAAAESRVESTRFAAVRALGETIISNDLDKLVQRVLAVESSEERAVTAAALTAACIRMADREGTVEKVAARFSQAPTEMRSVLFELMRDVGGDAALKRTVAGAHDPRDAVRDAATRVLGEWSTADVAPELLKLAQTLKGGKYQIRAMRGYIRVIRQFGLPLDERVAMSRQALRAAERNDEKILVLHALLRFPAEESLALSMDHFGDSGLKRTAAHVAVGIAERLPVKSAQTVEAMQRIQSSGIDPRLESRIKAVLTKLGI